MGISRQQALDCFASDDLIGIGMEADAVRRTLHPQGVVTYALDPVLDLSTTAEDFTPILAQVAEAVDLGATGVTLANPQIHEPAWLARAFRAIKQQFPSLRLTLTIQSAALLAQDSATGLAETLTNLHGAGLDALAGNAAGNDLEIHRAAHSLDIPTSASLTFGGHQTSDEFTASLEAIRNLQEEAQGFYEFTLLALPAPTGRDLDDPTAVEYLKTLAICRMLLDTIPHLQADWHGQGLKVLQMALRFGGNDAGSLLASPHPPREEEVRRLIRDAGFRPVQRDTLYRTLFLN